MSISTESEDAYAALMALTAASPAFTAAALTAAVPVTNADGLTFSMCTSSTLYNVSRGIDLAPSPPPPAPPPVSESKVRIMFRVRVMHGKVQGGSWDRGQGQG